MPEALRDPLTVVKAINTLQAHISEMGITLSCSSDFKEFAELRKQVRSDKVSPMFDPDFNNLNELNSFCIIAKNRHGRISAFQACRLDTVDGSLADWAMRWMTGHYLMRSELITPAPEQVAYSSVAREISGRVVYHGELWIDREFRNKDCSMYFPRLALMISLLKWQPTAIWGLIGGSVATGGLSVRIGYPHMESNFFRWDIAPKGAMNSEFVTLARKSDLEFLAADTVAKPL